VASHDVVRHREAQPCALVGGLGGEERLEDPLHDIGRHAGAVVAHRDHRRLVGSAGAQPDGREVRLARAVVQRHHLACLAAQVSPAFVGRITGVAHQVQEHPAHVLRDHLQLAQLGIEVALDGHVEVGVLRSGAVVREHGVLFEQGVDLHGA